MKNRLVTRTHALKESGKKGFTCFITAGHPTPDMTVEIMHGLVDHGADIIEIGFPFSDPMADGPVIQDSSRKALLQGMSLSKTLDIIAQFREKDNDTPIILMGYYNPVFSYGVADFANKAHNVGVDGLIIVDLTFEEEGEARPHFDAGNLSLIRFITPTTDDARAQMLLNDTSGFVYYVAVAGVTGSKQGDIPAIKAHIQSLRDKSNTPIYIGFGIKTPEDAAQMAAISDGIIVGSAIVSRLDEITQKQENGLHSVTSFVKTIADNI